MSDSFSVQVSNAEALRVLRKSETRIAYAVANSLNTTIKSVQREQRLELRRRFTVRIPFTERQIAIIDPFASASKRIMWTRIRVGQKPRLLLAQFETGGERRPFKGSRVAVPIPGGARATKEASVTESLRFTRLRLRRKSAGAETKRRKGGGTGPIVGAQGTFRIPNVGVFQRRGGAPRLLYSLTKSTLRLPLRLRYLDTARRVTAREFPGVLQREINKTLAYNIGR